MTPLKLWSVLGNSQRLDGGAMFGNAPRALWQRWIAVDEQNRIPLACRALLVREAGGRVLLLEAGIGAFFSPELRERYGVQESRHVLLENLAALGVAPEAVDVVVLSHLHFDHAGGVLAEWHPESPPALCFPRAQFVVGRRAFERAKAPHSRDRASFIAELPTLLEESGRLTLVDDAQSATLGEQYRFHFSDGHTPGLMMTELLSKDGPILYAADLIPGRPWLHVPITMGYDRYPELLIDEKRELLSELCQRQGRVFFTHDAEVAMSRVERDERGRFVAGESFEQLVGLPS